MTFFKWGMLIGLSAIAIPIIIHLLNRRKAQIVDWGAMEFLLGSLVNRNRRMLIEEILLLGLRCLLLALVALAMARPFIPPGSQVPWVILLPALLLAAIAFGVGTAVWHRRDWRWTLYGTALALILLATVAAAAERWLQLRRWVGAGGEQDVAIVIDGSASMTLIVDGKTNFERAVDEARSVLETVGQADAVSIIVAGPAPQVKTPVPIVEREEVKRILNELKPTRGSMAVLDALSAAAITLVEGQNPSKKIVFITDGQNVGWDTDNRVRWEFLAGTLKDLSTPPKLVCRTLPLPTDFRNAAIADLKLDRDVIGSDRPVRIDVRVENTGFEPLSPFDVKLEIDGELVQTKAVGQLDAGSAETVKFSHRFTRGGLHVAQAFAVVNDDLPADDNCARVFRTVDRLPVLIIDGNPAPRPLDRASAYIDIALDPRSDLERPAPDGTPPKKEKYGVLVETEILDAPDMTGREDFDAYGVVILANVPQLPAEIADKLSDFVEAGGGLLIALGDRAVPRFYNDWQGARGVPVAPARLGERKVYTDVDRSAKPAVSTFSHKALEKLAEKDKSDVDLASFTAYWRLQVDEADGAANSCGVLNTGDPLLVERRLGQGRVFMTAVSLDNRGGNLPTLQSFVPLVHEMVYYLVRPARMNWNFEPVSEIDLPLIDEAQSDAPAKGGGLRGDYYVGKDFRNFKLTRVDPVVKLSWPATPAPGMPLDDFSVRWTGSIVPRYSEAYTFTLHHTDDTRLWIDGKLVIPGMARVTGYYSNRTATIDLEANRRHDVRLEFIEYTGIAHVALYWSSRNQPKEVVPKERLSPQRPWSEQIGKEDHAELIAPDNSRWKVGIDAEGDSVLLHIRDAVEPGLYRLKLPEFIRQSLGSLLDRDGHVPFAVRGDVEESRLTGLSEREMDQVGQHADFFRADSSEQMTTVIAGGIPGHELWRYLAIAALVAVLAEAALTRWIAQQRRVGAVEPVDFTSGAVDPAAFRRRAKELLKVGSSN